MNRIVYIIGCMLFLLSFTACVTEELRKVAGEGEGYLRLKLDPVTTDLSSATQTKATTSIPIEDIPALSDFTIDIKRGGSSIDGFPKGYGDLGDESLVLPVGDYTIEAYSGVDGLLQSTPYFYASSNVTVLPNQQNEATVEAALANALLVPVVDEGLQKHYKSWVLSVKIGELSETLASNENTGGSLYIQAGQSVTLCFEGTNLLDQSTKKEWTGIEQTVACTQYSIQCNPDLSVFSTIQLIGKATHTYADGSLTGTDVTLNLNVNNAPTDAIETWDIKVLYNGMSVRTYSSLPSTSDVKMDVVSGWPYVPQGSTLSASVTLKSGDKIELTDCTMEPIPLPTFAAKVSGSTSYSVYENSDADAANKMDGSSIVDISSSVSISSEILNHDNYSDLLKVVYTTDSGQRSEESSPTFTGLAWQKHVLTATASFDGAIAEDKIDCHVTGLPYRAEPPKKELGWFCSQSSALVSVSWNDTYLRLGAISQSPEVSSPEFYIPSDITTDMVFNIKIHNKKMLIAWIKTDFIVNVNGNTYRQKGEEVEYKNYTVLGSPTLSSSGNVVILKSSYTMVTPYVDVYSVDIKYK